MSAMLITAVSPLGAGITDLGIADGVFVDPGVLEGRRDVRVIEGRGLIALPGLVDLHTHLRQPGMEHAETVASGSAAAALGGYTAVFAMPNTEPVADTPDITDTVHQWGKEAGLVDVRPIGAVTKGQQGRELAPLSDLAGGMARVRVFSDDGHCVFDETLMREALTLSAELGVVIAQHAQDPLQTAGAVMNDGALAHKLGLVGWPAQAEESIVARDVRLAEETGGRLHVCHVSTAGSLNIIRQAKKQGLFVTAEVTPHHLMLTEELVESLDPLYKVNPPLRRREDTLALREGVADGTIDIVATDHAPHPDEKKKCSFNQGAFGMLGLETALGVVRETLIATGQLDWAGLARVMSTTPASIGQLAGYSNPLALGEPAHLTLVDPDSSTPAPHGSLSSNNPYRGMELRGAVVHTFFHGTHTVANGNIVQGTSKPRSSM